MIKNKLRVYEHVMTQKISLYTQMAQSYNYRDHNVYIKSLGTGMIQLNKFRDLNVYNTKFRDYSILIKYVQWHFHGRRNKETWR